MFKADCKVAYKQLPIDPADQATAIAALRHPSEGKWYGLVTKTLIFGSVADVLRNNLLSRILTALVNRYLGIPLVRYSDDFAAISPAVLGGSAMRTFSRFVRSLGFELNDKKFDLDSEVVSLGLIGPFFPRRMAASYSFPFRKRNA